MYFFFGGDKKEDVKITNQFIGQVKSSLTNQFCQYCNKLPSTKVAFVPDLNKGFTCNKCQLTAVGNQFKNLGDKTLITNDKLSQTITKALINYQNIQGQSPQQVKQLQNQVKVHIKSSKQSIQKIKSQVKILKTTTDNKLNDIIKASQSSNTNTLYEQLNRKSKDKKNQSSQEISQLITKKSMVNKKGLHFIDEEQLQIANTNLDEKIVLLKSQTKILLKELDLLTNWINQIQF